MGLTLILARSDDEKDGGGTGGVGGGGCWIESGGGEGEAIRVALCCTFQDFRIRPTEIKM